MMFKNILTMFSLPIRDTSICINITIFATNIAMLLILLTFITSAKVKLIILKIAHIKPSLRSAFFIICICYPDSWVVGS